MVANIPRRDLGEFRLSVLASWALTSRLGLFLGRLGRSGGVMGRLCAVASARGGGVVLWSGSRARRCRRCCAVGFGVGWGVRLGGSAARGGGCAVAGCVCGCGHCCSVSSFLAQSAV